MQTIEEKKASQLVEKEKQEEKKEKQYSKWRRGR